MKRLIIIWLQTAKQCLLLCCYVLAGSIANAQFSPHNLVPNPSFENYNCCPVDIYTAAYVCKPEFWYGIDKGGVGITYLNACANNNITGVPVNFGGGAQLSISPNR